VSDLRATAGVLAILVALCALWYHIDEFTNAAEKPFRFLDLEAEQIDWLSVTNEHGALLDKFVNMQAARWLDEPPDNTNLGFTPPMGQVDYSTSKSQGTILFGTANKIAATCYARVPNDPRTYLVPWNLALHFLASPQHLRKRDIFNLPLDSVTDVSITYSSEHWNFSRGASGTVRLTGTHSHDVYPPDFRQLLSDINCIEAQGFSSRKKHPKKYFGFDKPSLSVNIGETKFSVGNRVPEQAGLVFLEFPGMSTIYLVEAQSLLCLSKDAIEFNDRTPFCGPHGEIGLVALAINDKPHLVLELIRISNGWEARWFATRKSTAQDAATPVMDMLSRFRCPSYRHLTNEQLSDFGLCPPRITAEFYESLSDKPHLLSFGHPTKGKAWLLLPDQGIVSIPLEMLSAVERLVLDHGRVRER